LNFPLKQHFLVFSNFEHKPGASTLRNPQTTNSIKSVACTSPYVDEAMTSPESTACEYEITITKWQSQMSLTSARGTSLRGPRLPSKIERIPASTRANEKSKDGIAKVGAEKLKGKK
jgi:hypothetical protein